MRLSFSKAFALVVGVYASSSLAATPELAWDPCASDRGFQTFEVTVDSIDKEIGKLTSKICFNEIEVRVNAVRDMGGLRVVDWCCAAPGEDGSSVLYDYRGYVYVDDWFQVRDRRRIRDEILDEIHEKSKNGDETRALFDMLRERRLPPFCPDEERRARVEIGNIERSICVVGSEGKGGIRVAGLPRESAADIAGWCYAESRSNVLPILRGAAEFGGSAVKRFDIPTHVELRPEFLKQAGLYRNPVSRLVGRLAGNPLEVVLWVVLLALLATLGRSLLRRMRKTVAGADVSRRNRGAISPPDEGFVPGESFPKLEREAFIAAMAEQVEHGVGAALHAELSKVDSWIEKLARAIAYEVKALSVRGDAGHLKAHSEESASSPDISASWPSEAQQGNASQARDSLGAGVLSRVYVTEASHAGSYTEGLRFLPAGESRSTPFFVETADERNGKLWPNIERGDWHPSWGGLFDLTADTWPDPSACRPVPVTFRNGFWMRRT